MRLALSLELRPLPSTGITQLRRYYEPLRHPRAPGLSLTGVRFGRPRPRQGASRVACAFLVYMLPPLPRCGGWASSSLVRPTVSAFPGTTARSARTSSFSRFARRSLALRPAHSRCHQFVTRYPKASAISLPCMGLFLSRVQIWLQCFFAAQVVGIWPAAGARDFVTIKGGTRHRARRTAAIQPCIR